MNKVSFIVEIAFDGNDVDSQLALTAVKAIETDICERITDLLEDELADKPVLDWEVSATVSNIVTGMQGMDRML